MTLCKASGTKPAPTILLAVLCYSTLTSSTTTPEEKKWAMSIISGAAGGIIGYPVRK